MKKGRQRKIIEIIEKHTVETQGELTDYLRKAGYAVTQATVSRDIRELRLSKVPVGDGRQKYAIHSDGPGDIDDKYTGVLRAGFKSMDMAQNILVIKTYSGMAMAVAAAVDALKFPQIVGSIAGDDTVMCAIRTAGDTVKVMNEIEKLLG